MDDIERTKWISSHYSRNRKMLWLHYEEMGGAISFGDLVRGIQRIRVEHPEVVGTEAWLEVNDDEGLDLTFYRPLTPEEELLRQVNEEYRRKRMEESPRYTYTWVEEE